ncbi:MAG: hypothetical protein R2695_08215 [Acidimicrobiales bacterium]
MSTIRPSGSTPQPNISGCDSAGWYVGISFPIFVAEKLLERVALEGEDAPAGRDLGLAGVLSGDEGAVVEEADLAVDVEAVLGVVTGVPDDEAAVAVDRVATRSLP